METLGEGITIDHSNNVHLDFTNDTSLCPSTLPDIIRKHILKEKQLHPNSSVDLPDGSSASTMSAWLFGDYTREAVVIEIMKRTKDGLIIESAGYDENGQRMSPEEFEEIFSPERLPGDPKPQKTDYLLTEWKRDPSNPNT